MKKIVFSREEDIQANIIKSISPYGTMTITLKKNAKLRKKYGIININVYKCLINISDSKYEQETNKAKYFYATEKDVEKYRDDLTIVGFYINKSDTNYNRGKILKRLIENE